MQNPIRRISKIMGLDAEAEITNENDVENIKAVRRVSKLWIAGFGGFVALMGSEMIKEGGLPTISIEQNDPLSNVVELGLDAVLATITLAPVAVAVGGCTEFIRIHGLATERLNELQSPEAG